MTELPIDVKTRRVRLLKMNPSWGQLLIDYLRAADYAPTLINRGDRCAVCASNAAGSILLDLYDAAGRDGLTYAGRFAVFPTSPL